MTEKSIEERLKALEAAVADLQRRLGAPVSMKDWLEQIGGVKDIEAFEEMSRLGREFRESQRIPEDEEAAS
jgi:hypothetical protein